MNISPIVALVFSSILAAFGQVLFKLGADGAATLFDFVNVRTIAGLSAYGFSTLIWIWSLSRVPLNVAYGFTALTFVLVFLGSGAVLREAFSVWTYLGLTLVLGGFFCLGIASRFSG